MFFSLSRFSAQNAQEFAEHMHCVHVERICGWILVLKCNNSVNGVSKPLI